MNKPNEPLRPAVSDEVRDEILRRMKTYEADKALARPARDVLLQMLRQPPADVKS
jgi:hypothetical protein